jgi:hypothetical protein
VMDGKLQPFVDGLVTHYQAEMMKNSRDDDGAASASVH